MKKIELKKITFEGVPHCEKITLEKIVSQGLIRNTKSNRIWDNYLYQQVDKCN